MGFRLLFFIVFLFIIELYAFQAFKTILKDRWFLISYAAISVAILVYIVYGFFSFDRSVGQTKQTMFVMGLMLVV